jgi:hypothetical protein
MMKTGRLLNTGSLPVYLSMLNAECSMPTAETGSLFANYRASSRIER